MKQIICWILLLTTTSAFSQDNLTSHVNPFIGTQRMGHCYPGATVPFGMVQLSPETDTVPYAVDGKYNPDVYAYCSGYQYDDNTIVGFSHTHFSGTGHSDLGDILIMPTTGKLQMNPGTANNPSSGYRSRFSHNNETAKPGYYKVLMDDYDISAELTATSRVGLHKYTFPESTQSHIILDPASGIYNYDEKTIWSFIRVENDTLVTGYVMYSGWARTRTVYFAMAFSKPFSSYGQQKLDKTPYGGFWRKFDESQNFPEMAGRHIRLHFDFETEQDEQILIKLALSPTSTAAALKNMQTEIPHWDFNQTRQQANNLWEKKLSKIQIEALNPADKENFYTALYHTCLGPIEYMDVDSLYRGLDQNNHKAHNFTNYTVFSLWDTYRALHPLFNIIQPARNADMVRSMLAHYDQSVHNMLPVWSHYANENWCMIGYHSVPVIADAYVKGTITDNINHALEACATTAGVKYYDGLEYYMELGYVPEDKNSSSVSKTLEYAYDDWCIAQLAQKAGNRSHHRAFINRSRNFENVYDASIGFMRPKLSDGTFKKDFNTLGTHGQGFIEGNAWNYSLYVPHDIPRMIELMGGKDRFSSHLDSLFTQPLADKYIAHTEDITRDGIIGMYVHGNEPGHHIPYLYNWCDQPRKTQERVRMILQTMYGNTPDGLCGNDDVGQMSAWYIFSALGFYPVCPASPQYALGSPLVKSATINLENGNQFTIQTVNQSEENVYIEKIELNGKVMDRLYLLHEEVMQGGRIVFYMTD